MGYVEAETLTPEFAGANRIPGRLLARTVGVRPSLQPCRLDELLHGGHNQLGLVELYPMCAAGGHHMAALW